MILSKRRARERRAPLFAVWALMFVVAPAIGQTPTTAPGPPNRGQATQPLELSDSEISVIESGGIAGRVHSVRLFVAGGRVNVEYRAREAPRTAPPSTGFLDVDRYMALWRELEAMAVWQIRSPKATRGADLMQTEIRLRFGESSHIVRWDDGLELPPDIRRLADVARRILAAGRESVPAR